MGCQAVDAQNETPAFLLIVRETVRPDSVAAYNENELKLAMACATLSCPHPYVALTTLGEPTEVWWLNAFASAEQRDGLNEAYARNQPLMDLLVPLGKRKEQFRASFMTAATEYIAALSDATAFRLPTARFIVVSVGARPANASAAFFGTEEGERFGFKTAATLEAAQDAVVGLGPGARILSIQPQWSFPDQAWVNADPEFWSSSAAVN